ncbi:MAG: DUF3313 family protein [Tepidisphaeraceae bacterium]
MSRQICAALAMSILVLTVGCAGKKAPLPSGFISDYSRLAVADDGAMQYRSPRLREYSTFMIDPVEFRAARKESSLTPQERAEVARYFKNALEQELTKRGYKRRRTRAGGRRRP